MSATARDQYKVRSVYLYGTLRVSLGRGVGTGGMGVHVYARIWVCGEACGVGLRKAACVEEAWTFVVYLTYYGLLHEHVCQTRSHNESRKSKLATAKPKVCR